MGIMSDECMDRWADLNTVSLALDLYEVFPVVVHPSPGSIREWTRGQYGFPAQTNSGSRVPLKSEVSSWTNAFYLKNVLPYLRQLPPSRMCSIPRPLLRPSKEWCLPSHYSSS